MYIEQYEPFIHPFQPGLCGIAPNRSYCVGLMAWAYMFLNDNRRPTRESTLAEATDYSLNLQWQ